MKMPTREGPAHDALRCASTDEVRRKFVELGIEWISLLNDRPGGSGQREEMEDQAVALLQANRDIVPSLSNLKREVANWSWFPSVVENLWRRAFPPTAEELAQGRIEWDLVDRVADVVESRRAAGDAVSAEALRKSAVTFFNQWLSEGDVDTLIRKKVRSSLRKVP